MDGHIVGSMISANSITGEQIQANSIKTANLELSAQQKIQNATDEETVKALIKADLDGFESTLSKEFITVENATTQIQQATEVAVKEATQSIIDNAVTESMGAVDGQLNDKLNQYTGNTLLPAIAEKAEEVLQNAEDYVATQLESYATKQELSSSISQTREQIELSVSEKYTTKTESATIITEAIDGITVGAINRVFGTGESKSFKFNGGANETWLPYKFSNDISDKEVYVSFNYTLTGTAQNGSQIEFAPSYLKKANNQTVYRPKHIFFTSNRLQDVNITDTVSFTTKDFQDISPSSTSYIRFVGNGFTGTLSISEVQIKPGNSKTTWSPAPEDTITDITNAKNDAIGSANNTLIATIVNYYTKSETDSAISVAKDEINLGVSNVYETKETVTTKVNNAVNNIQVGSRNLWVVSDLINGYESNGNIIGDDTQYKTRQSLVATNGATSLVYQCWNPNGVVNESNSNRVAFFDANGGYITSYQVDKLNGQTYQKQLIKIPENAAYMRLGAICGVSSYDGTIKIKFELGNKPTDYSLAPEDVESEFTVLESETKTLKESVSSLQLGADSINASVKSLEETVINTTNGLAQDIQSVQNQVNLAMTSDDVKIEIQKEISKGANKVSTSTGFTFDDNGLKVSKSDSEMSTQITEDGMKVYHNDEAVLTANNQGVNAKNLRATTYLIIGSNSRMEDFTCNNNKRTAMFWIGD